MMTTSNREVPWVSDARSAWLDTVRPWLHAELCAHGLTSSGEFECVRERPWAIVLRVPTPQGFVYFKAAGSGGRHEPGLVTELAQRWSDRVPTPLAIDRRCGWMLLRDYGRTLREALGGADSLEVWQHLLPLYAEIQIASCFEMPRWLALGVPDRRLAALPELLGELLSDEAALCIGRSDGLRAEERAAICALLPEFEACCRELAAMPYPATLDHGDLHAGNILIGNGAYWFFDWGDANITHPFCSLLVICSMLVDDFASSDGQRRIARLRDAYLEPWSAHAPARSLRPLCAAALWVAHVGRALDWNHMLKGTGEAARTEWQPQVAKWLRLWLKRQELLRAGGSRFGSTSS